MKTIIKIIALVLSSAYLFNTEAATTTNNLTASSTLAAACTLSMTDINFGVINPGVVNTASGSLQITCTKGTSYNAAPTTGTTFRSMTNIDSGDVVKYYFKKTIKGVTSIGWYYSPAYFISSTSTGATDIYPITATTQVSYPTPGVYSETITVAVNY